MPFQNHSPITRICHPPPFLKILHSPTSPANLSSQVFLFNRNATVKLSSINTIHVKQKHNVGFFIFKFTLSTKQVYIVGKVFPILSFLCCIQRNPSLLISKHLERKYFSMEQLSIDSYMLLCNSVSINQ